MAGTPAKPQPCVFFAQGKCRHGTSCRFFHAEREDLANSPQPCRFFLQNACTAGRDCRFSHDPAHLRDAALVATTSAGERRVARQAVATRCRFYDSPGGCATGQQCMFQHIDGPVRTPPRPARTSNVKMHVLRPKPKTSDVAAPSQPEGQGTQQDAAASPPAQQDDEYEEEEEDEEAEGETKHAASGYDQQVAMLSDFLSKEEELYYYGAPGEFDMTTAAAEPAGQTPKKMSYAEIASKYLDQKDSAQYSEHVEARRKPCVFFLQGLCRYGDKCFNSHELESAAPSLEEQVLVEQEIEYSKDLECGICLEKVLSKGERFGVLSNCDHAFCLSCVRNWRANEDMPKQTVRHCPLCRTHTYFVIPSNRMTFTQERKQALVLRYKNNLAQIPCRHFDQGRGECPFGTSCFYAHRYPDGTEDLREVRTAIDSVGQHDVLRKIRLEHFFENLEV